MMNPSPTAHFPYNWLITTMMSVSNYFGFFLIVVMISFSVNGSNYLVHAADPTDGFTLVPLTDSNFLIQKPYNEPLDDRYSFENGTRRMWVYTNDKPFKAGSPTRPRTEVRILGLDYYSGVHQFEGYAYVPKGTSGVTIMQIFGARDAMTTLQLRIYDGVMKYYRNVVVDSDNLYDRWFRLNVIHDADEGRITIFIDGVQKYVVSDHGPGDMYFKFGAYAALAGSSNYMEARWKGIKVYKK